MARVHVVRGQDRVFGFTLDEQGTNLPRQYGPWTAFKTIELYHDEPYQGVDVTVCLDDIGKHGFYLTAAHKRTLRWSHGQMVKTLLWFSVVAGPPDMHGRWESSQDWPKLASI